MVDRHQWVEVEYQTVTGEIKKTKFEDNNSRIFQHEFDHLDKVSTTQLFYTIIGVNC